MKNKRGWIRIVEAFFGIVLIIGIILAIINSGYFGTSDVSEDVYEIEDSMLDEIKLNSSLRIEVLNVSADSLPVNWSDFDNMNLSSIKGLIMNRTMNLTLECSARLCSEGDSCLHELDIQEDVYVRTAFFSAELGLYDPRQLKLFCWNM